MKKEYKILHIEDSISDSDIIKRILHTSDLDYQYYLADNEQSVSRALKEFNPDVVLCDHSLPAFNSKIALELCREKNPFLPFILVTGAISEEFSVEMLKLGIDDYLLKSNLKRMTAAIILAYSKKENERKIKNIQSELLQSEARLRAIFENSSVGLMLLDAEYTILELNNRADYLIYISIGKKLNRNDNLLSNAPNFRYADLKRNFERVLQGESLKYETVYFSNTDKEITFQICLNPIFNAEAKVLGICKTFEDITERKRAEKSLIESENEIKLLAESMPEIVWSANKEGENIYFNQKWVEYTGLPLEKSFGKGWVVAFHPEDIEEVLTTWKDAYLNGLVYSHDCRIKRYDGVYRWWLIRGVPKINEHGEILKWYGTITDIEKIKTAELQQRNLTGYIQTIREEERTTLAREVHDELGQQMSSLKMEMSTFQDLKYEDIPAIQKNMIGRVDEAIRTIRRIVIQLRPAILDDLGLVAALEWQLKEFEKNTGLTCSLEVSVDKESFTTDINTTVFRIFQESLTNIIRYAKATTVIITLQEKNNLLQLEIIDNGIGISEESKNNKTSFGLLGMKERAAMINGQLELMRVNESGTKVRLIIPI